MGDEIKSIRENLIRSLLSNLGNGKDGNRDGAGVDSGTTRDLIVTLLSRAGKGKDEVVQVLAREIGFAVAAMMREPLSQLAKHQKLQVTFEFVPKEGHEDEVFDKKKSTPKTSKKSPQTRRRRGNPR